MEQPPEPKRRRSQRLQEASATAEAGGSRGAPQPAVSGSAAATAALAAHVQRPTPDDVTAAAAAATDTDGSSSACSPFARILLPELLQRVAGFMERNEVACSLRLVCTAAAAGLPGPRYTTVRLSEPSPPAVFEQQWSRPDALRSLNRKQREQLELLTARSGSIANLQTLATRGGLPRLSHSPQYWGPLLAGAARHGRLELCAWLREQGAPVTGGVVAAAAEGGDLAVVQSLVDETSWDGFSAACTAARHGHVHVLDWLLGRMQPYDPDRCGLVLSDAARGCTLGVLQRLHARFFAGRQLSGWSFYRWLDAAAGSPTPDWQAKVEWLEALGCPRSSYACWTAASQPDALARLQWLVGRGYARGKHVARAAAEAGHAEALHYVLAQGVVLDARTASDAMRCAARHGQLSILQVLHGEVGVDVSGTVVKAAAEGGHLPVVAWAAEQLGDELKLTARLFRAAARSGSWPLMLWLHERRCAWDATVFAAAVCSCSEEQLEWLVERGCPMGDNGAAYATAVHKHDLLALRCLRRLGCPFAPDGHTFTMVVYELDDCDRFAAPLACLLDAGCPVDWAAALRAAGDAAMRSWLEEQWQQRSGRVWEGRLRSGCLSSVR